MLLKSPSSGYKEKSLRRVHCQFSLLQWLWTGLTAGIFREQNHIFLQGFTLFSPLCAWDSSLRNSSPGTYSSCTGLSAPMLQPVGTYWPHMQCMLLPDLGITLDPTGVCPMRRRTWKFSENIASLFISFMHSMPQWERKPINSVSLENFNYKISTHSTMRELFWVSDNESTSNENAIRSCQEKQKKKKKKEEMKKLPALQILDQGFEATG